MSETTSSNPKPGTIRFMAERIKAAVYIPEAAGWFGFDYTNPDVRHPCPSCVESSASKKTLQVFDEGRAWKCYHCDAGGDVISWIAARLGVRAGEAIGVLASRLGMNCDPEKLLEYLRSELAKPKLSELQETSKGDAVGRAVHKQFDAWSKVYADKLGPDDVKLARLIHWTWGWLEEKATDTGDIKYVKAAERFALTGVPPGVSVSKYVTPMARTQRLYAGLLSPRPKYLKYATEVRGMSASELREWGVGCCPAKLSAGFVETADLGVTYFQGNTRIHAMRGRLTFPIRDIIGNTLAFAGRIVGEGGPKYLNTANSPLFQKDRTLFGIDTAFPSILRTKQAILVESYMDAVACHRAGFTNTVAVMGVNTSRWHARLLARLATEVVVTFNGDEAGLVGATRASYTLRSPRYRLRIARLPTDYDADELVCEGRVRRLRHAIESAREVGGVSVPAWSTLALGVRPGERVE